MIDVVYKYRSLANDIPNLISKSYYKSEYFAKVLELKLPTYYRKLRENNFNLDEVVKITEVLFPEEYIKMKLSQSDIDVKEGRVKSSKQVRLNAAQILGK